MNEINVEVTGGSTTKLLTAGKYCDKDILVTASGSGVEYSNNSVTKINANTFDSFLNLKKFTSNSLEEILGTYAFNACRGLVSIDCPKLWRMNDYTFVGCTSLENANLPLVTYVGSGSFVNCTALKEIHLPSVNTFYTSPFQNCTNLEKAEFDTKITFSRATAFKGCYALKALILRSNEMCPATIATAFNECSIANKTGYIYVPKSTIEEYRVATNWVVHASQFRAIEDYPEICGGVE